MTERKPGNGDPWQTLKIMALFLLAVLALMALQFGRTWAHQMRWQLR